MKDKQTTRSLLVSVDVDDGFAFYTVSGVIKDSLNNPLEGIYVSDRPLSGAESVNLTSTFRYAYTDSNGFYALTNLAPNPTNITVNRYPLSFSGFPKPASRSAQTVQTAILRLDWRLRTPSP